MPTPSRGAATNRPDTSNANVARVLRGAVRLANTLANGIDPLRDWTVYYKMELEFRALADALEQQPVSDKALLGALTKDNWAERVERTLDIYFSTTRGMDSVLREVFPELAPSDD